MKPSSTRSIKEKFSKKICGLNSLELFALIVLVIIASITQSWHFLTTARLTESGIIFSQFHDSLWHLALIKELARSFPPQHPGLAGLPLKNYHFLSDLILMLTAKITTLSPETIYFHLAPPVVSALFSLSVFSLAKLLSRSNRIAITAIAFTIFGGSAAFLIPLLLGSGTPWFANSFMLDQPFDQLTNVHTVLGFSIFLFASSFLHRYLKEDKKSDALWSGLLFGLSTSVKAYAGAVAVAALLLTSAIEYTLKKRSKIFYPALIATSILISLTILTSSTQKPPLTFAPGWILKRMVEDSGRFYNEKLTQLDQHYQATRNIPRLIQINLEEIFLYVAGNLGTRLVAFIWIIKKLINIRRTMIIELFLISAIFISLGIPLVFVQPVSVYNTIQFSPYALMLLSILLVLWASERKNKTFWFAVLFILTIPTTVQTFALRHSQKEEDLSKTEYQALSLLTNIPQDAVVFTLPESDHRHLMKVPGIGGRRAYFSGETFAVLTDTSYKERIREQEEFFTPETSKKKKEEILKNAKITHIYSDSKQQTKNLKKLEKEKFPIHLIFENKKAAVFKVQ
jgi:hypothetical protein